MASVTVVCTKDASAFKQGNSWSGWDFHNPVGINDNGSIWRSFIYCPVNMTGWTSLVSAKLYVRGHKVSGVSHILSNLTRTLLVNRMISDWGEGTNRGENVWSTNEPWDWNNRAGQYATADESSTVFTNGITHQVWYEVDITAIAQRWFTGSPNYGVILRAATEASGFYGLHFWSRQQGGASWPYMVFEYTTNIAPNAPTGLYPTGNALLNTLNPTLTGTHSDPDAGDYITAYQIRLFEDDEVTLVWDSTTEPGGQSTTFSKVYAGPVLVGNRFYKWNARTRDKGGEWGPYATLSRFKTNTPPNPPIIGLAAPRGPSGTVLTLTPTLNITHSDNDANDTAMYGYRVQLETSAGAMVWDSGDIDTSDAPVTVKSFTYSGPALSWQTGYRFRARTKDANQVWGNFGEYYYFTTHTTLAPIILDPTGSEVITGLVPTFYAQRAIDSDTVISYYIILYADDGFTVIWDSGTLSTGISSGHSFSKVYSGAGLNYNTAYRWIARIDGLIGGTSAWSPVERFLTPVDATVPVLDLPTPNNAPTNNNITSLTPTFTGQRASSAFTNYQLQVYPASATQQNLGSPIWDTGDTVQASSTSFSRLYSGPALAWFTQYKWRVRVGTPALGNWTGLASFNMDVAAAAVITAPAEGAWITDSTPDFAGTTQGGELAVQRQVHVYDTAAAALMWDSTLLSQASSTTLSTITYAGPDLTPGKDYTVYMRYARSGGLVGPFSGGRTFHLNAPPSIPTNLEPTPGYILNGNVTPIFRALFNDPDKASMADYPTVWNIEIRNNNTDVLVHNKALTLGLVSGVNQYIWGSNSEGADSGLAYGVDYKWRTWFTDSKSAVGPASSYQIFRAGQPPTVAIVTPSNGSNVNITRPLIDWTFTGQAGKTQTKFQVLVYKSPEGILVYNSNQQVSTATQFTLPSGVLTVNGSDYTVYVYAWDTEGLQSNAASATFELQLDAPPAIQGLSATVYEDESRISLDWDPSTLGGAFATYVIYRREVGSQNWGMIGLRRPESNTQFSDWYSGQRRMYEYRVTVVKIIGGLPDLESPDSLIVAVRLESDVWFVIGQDRSQDHIFELPVDDEDHTRPVQQEAFETLGTNRKAIIRGFVLGHEGSIRCIWTESESALAKRQVEYLLYYAGPHILKNPFGDVFEVTFGSPDYKYQAGGNLNVTLTWIEVGSNTNNPLLTPDDFLATIGAQ